MLADAAIVVGVGAGQITELACDRRRADERGKHERDEPVSHAFSTITRNGSQYGPP